MRTVRRRLSTISGLYAFLVARGDVALNPVPRGLPTRREGNRPSQGVPLVRAPRTLPRVLTPEEVDALTGRLRTHRDRAMVAAMVLGGLRRCEVLGLRLEDLRCHLVELVGAYRPDEPRSTTTPQHHRRRGLLTPITHIMAMCVRWRRVRNSLAAGRSRQTVGSCVHAAKGLVSLEGVKSSATHRAEATVTD